VKSNKLNLECHQKVSVSHATQATSMPVSDESSVEPRDYLGHSSPYQLQDMTQTACKQSSRKVGQVVGQMMK